MPKTNPYLRGAKALYDQLTPEQREAAALHGLCQIICDSQASQRAAFKWDPITVLNRLALRYRNSDSGTI